MDTENKSKPSNIVKSLLCPHMFLGIFEYIFFPIQDTTFNVHLGTNYFSCFVSRKVVVLEYKILVFVFLAMKYACNSFDRILGMKYARFSFDGNGHSITY